MRIGVRTPASFTAFGAGYAALQARLALSRAMPGSRRAVFLGSRDSTRDQPRRHREDLAELCRLLVSGGIDPVVTVWPLVEARAVHVAHDAGQIRGQAVLTTAP